MSSPKTLERSSTAQVTLVEASDLHRWAGSFILAKRAAKKAAGTIRFYTEKFKNILRWCDQRQIKQPGELTPQLLREFLLHMEETGHNAGGVRCHYKAIKAFIRWWADETEPDNWKDPFRKVPTPFVPEELLDPVDPETVRAILAVCGTRQRTRNRAIILTLYDTGLRASELINLDVSDADAIEGALLVRHGKGRKVRRVFLAGTARRALRAYLRERGNESGPLFKAEHGGRLSYKGLRAIVELAAKRAGVKFPPLHSFRRAFALDSLRSGMDSREVQKLMGQTDPRAIKPYLKFTDDDLREAHDRHSPVERARLAR